MEETKEESTLMSHIIRWGLIVSGVSITLTVLLYAIDYTLMVQLKTLFISLLIYLGITIYGGIDYRKSVGGYLKYGKAYMHGLGVLVVSGFVATLFAFVLYNFIDSELPQKLTDASLENTRAMMENFGAPEDSIEPALEKAREQSEKQFSPSGQALGFVYMVIFSAIMALISALFVRKNEPEETI
ncbi:MAG: DUF4199 domain-containing protein [Cyclobacteriaceae bacterium]|nr:DUF4199 domain-containing protein [Cyclobacteriaceae bacterium]